jgi:hypothetical protein
LQAAQCDCLITETVHQPEQDRIRIAMGDAQQPLTMEELRQLPGVGGSRLKSNVAKLVAEEKIQETPAGYVVVPT